MEMCEYCGKREAVTNCDMCGAAVCEKHDRRLGCAVCGGETKVD